MTTTELDTLLATVDLTDPVERLMLADALEECGRDDEAERLRRALDAFTVGGKLVLVDDQDSITSDRAAQKLLAAGHRKAARAVAEDRLLDTWRITDMDGGEWIVIDGEQDTPYPVTDAKEPFFFAVVGREGVSVAEFDTLAEAIHCAIHDVDVSEYGYEDSIRIYFADFDDASRAYAVRDGILTGVHP